MACGFQAVRHLSLPVADVQPAPLWLTSFDAARFDLAAFALHGIAMPDRIGTSVRKWQAGIFSGWTPPRFLPAAPGSAPTCA